MIIDSSNQNFYIYTHVPVLALSKPHFSWIVAMYAATMAGRHAHHRRMNVAVRYQEAGKALVGAVVLSVFPEPRWDITYLEVDC